MRPAQEMALWHEKRGEFMDMKYLTPTRTSLVYNVRSAPSTPLRRSSPLAAPTRSVASSVYVSHIHAECK